MLLLLDVYGLECATNYSLLFIVKSPNIGYIVLNVMHVTMSTPRGLYPKLDLWTANKLHYITLQIHVIINQIFKINFNTCTYT
jgi:uncharacterized membrane protein